MSQEPSLIAHLERHLGRMSGGYTAGTIQVGSFRDIPQPGVTTLVTLGLSKHILRTPRGKNLRQELVTTAATKHDADRLGGFLSSLAESLARSHRAVLRGELLGPSESIAGTNMRSAYATVPSLFPEEFGQLDGTDPDTVFAWIIPVTDDEATFVRGHGWSRFETALEAREPDLFNLERASVV